MPSPERTYTGVSTLKAVSNRFTIRGDISNPKVRLIKGGKEGTLAEDTALVTCQHCLDQQSTGFLFQENPNSRKHSIRPKQELNASEMAALLLPHEHHSRKPEQR